MSNLAALTAFALLLAATVDGQATICLNAVPMPNYNSSGFRGVWFTPYDLVQNLTVPEIKCLVHYVQVDDDGIFTSDAEYIIVENNATILRTHTGIPIDGVRSRLNLFGSPRAGRSFDSVIIDTDYNHYMITVTCVNDVNNKGLMVRILSKQKTMSADTLDMVKQKLRENAVPDALKPMEIC